ncbi:MAG: FecR domain-containing protein [Phycisphaerae bacterium]|nr:FecR domain-containing protein [Phycisphaerae bacterium]
MKQTILTISLVVLATVGMTWGQDAKKTATEKPAVKKTAATPPKPAAAKPAKQPVKAKAKTAAANAAAEPFPETKVELGEVAVESVKGSANKCSVKEGKGSWTPVKVGDKLDEFSLIRTGLGAEVVIVFNDRAKFTVKAATKIGIATVRKSGGVYQAKLGLKYGAMKASIDRTKGQNDFRVATPVGALAVEGSRANFAFSADRGFGLHSNQSQWNVNNNNGQTRGVPQGGRTNTNLDSTNQIATKKLNTHVGDPGSGLTPEEQYWLNVNGGGRGILDFTGSSNDFGPGMIGPVSGCSSPSQSPESKGENSPGYLSEDR